MPSWSQFHQRNNSAHGVYGSCPQWKQTSQGCRHTRLDLTPYRGIRDWQQNPPACVPWQDPLCLVHGAKLWILLAIVREQGKGSQESGPWRKIHPRSLVIRAYQINVISVHSDQVFDVKICICNPGVAAANESRENYWKHESSYCLIATVLGYWNIHPILTQRYSHFQQEQQWNTSMTVHITLGRHNPHAVSLFDDECLPIHAVIHADSLMPPLAPKIEK